jgi:hypothetical protein
MSDQPPRTKGFWQTVPGILTGIAGMLTAIGGLLAILVQVGVIGGSSNAPQPGPVANATAPRSVSQTPAASPAAVGWANAIAIMTANDGTEYRSRAETFRYCVSAGAGVYFNNAQNIAFEKMTLLEVLRSDVALSPGGRADVRITLTTGAVMTGTIDAGCDFIMQADAGRVDLYPDKVKKIEFTRPRS